MKAKTFKNRMWGSDFMVTHDGAIIIYDGMGMRNYTIIPTEIKTLRRALAYIDKQKKVKK